MAKNAFTDWDATASNNTDLGGIGITGASPVSNFDGALREMMAQLKSGALPLAGGTMTGALQAPYFTAKYNGINNPVYNIYDASGVRRALVQWDAATGVILIRNYAADGTTAINSLSIPGSAGDASYNSNVMVHGGNIFAQMAANVTALGVGSIALLAHGTTATAISAGSTYAGSALRQANLAFGTTAVTFSLGSAPVGTWEALNGSTNITAQNSVAVFMRIS